jgi:ABC-type nitrate/sulfonate/bicarbonate transport system permease component
MQLAIQWAMQWVKHVIETRPPRDLRAKLKAVLPALLLGAGVVTLLELGSRAGLIPRFVLPAPSAVGIALLENFDVLAGHSAQTLLEVVIGFSFAVGFGSITALFMSAIPFLRRMLMPWFIVSQTVPLVALAPLMLVWFGFGLEPKIIIVVLACFFPITVSFFDGLERTPPEHLEIMRSYNATLPQTYRFARVPAALPALFSGLKTSAAYAVIAAIFAEYVGAYQGLGIWLFTNASVRATANVIAGVVLSCVYSLLIVWAVQWLEARVLRYKTAINLEP